MWRSILKVLLLFLLILSLQSCSAVKLPNKKSQASRANVELGLAYLQSHHLQKAFESLSLALDEAPHDPLSHQAMGVYYLRTGKQVLSRRQFELAISLAPNSGAAHNNYGVFLCRQGEDQKAAQQFRLALEAGGYRHVSLVHHNLIRCSRLSKSTAYLRVNKSLI